MKALVVALGFGVLMIGPEALARPVFTAFVATDAQRVGSGGELVIVDGMEMWSNGSPPRTFEIVGYITDRRGRTGPFGPLRMATRGRNIVTAARENGGDAVILVSDERQVVGIDDGTLIENANSRYAVIRWVSDVSRKKENPSVQELLNSPDIVGIDVGTVAAVPPSP